MPRREKPGLGQGLGQGMTVSGRSIFIWDATPRLSLLATDDGKTIKATRAVSCYFLKAERPTRGYDKLYSI